MGNLRAMSTHMQVVCAINESSSLDGSSESYTAPLCAAVAAEERTAKVEERVPQMFSSWGKTVEIDGTSSLTYAVLECSFQ